MKNSIKIIKRKIFFLIFLISQFIFSQYFLDNSFNNFELPQNKFYLDGIQATKSIQQPDNKILIVYQTYDYNTIDKVYALARIDANNYKDPSFNVQNFNGKIYDIALQKDGKIIVAGSFTKYGLTDAKNLIRLNTDGSIDTSFNIGTGFTYETYSTLKYIEKIAIQKDGKILVSGDFVKYNGAAKNYMARLNTDGTLDNSFTLDSTISYGMQNIMITSDDKIIVVKGYNLYRVLINGTIDPTFRKFDPYGFFNSYNITFSTLDSNGNIVIAGDVLNSSLKQKYILKFSSDAYTTIFFTNKIYGYASSTSINTIVIQPDNKMIVGGYFNYFDVNDVHTYKPSLIRLNEDLTLDNTFKGKLSLSEEGYNGIETIVNLNILNDGSVLCLGRFKLFNNVTVNNIVKFLPDGEKDVNFDNYCKGFDAPVQRIFPQTDGKFIITGEFYSYNDKTRERILRLNSDGSLDTSFNVNTKKYISAIYFPTDVVTQSDGKILISSSGTGNFLGTKTNGGSVIRLNSDGSYDDSFINMNYPNKGVYGDIKNLVIDDDGKLYIPSPSRFNEYSSLDNKILVLNSDGTFYKILDISANVIRKLPDGKFIISSYDNVAKKVVLKRIDKDGIIDNSFISDTSLPTLSMFYLQPDLKIIAFSNLLSGHNLYRFNVDGTKETTFPTSYYSDGMYTEQYPYAYQNDGKFYTANIRNQDILRHNSNGSIDTTFNVGTGFDFADGNVNVRTDLVAAINIIGNNILVGGNFRNFNGSYVRYLAKIYNSQLSTNENTEKEKLIIYPNPVHDFINFNNNNIKEFEIYNYNGELVLKGNISEKKIDVSKLKKGNYLLNLKGFYIKITKTFIKD